jgi:hypothetical protein
MPYAAFKTGFAAALSAAGSTNVVNEINIALIVR